MSDLAGQLREYTAIRYIGDCKCGNCRLVPRPFIDVVADRVEALEATLREIADLHLYPEQYRERARAALAPEQGK